ncbi:MAG: molybdopterin-dependent oxidoreductase [Candidatus Coatesbacteria bacterium]|nr:molybdopterin-dependent oxidoreductase [Candidatus Coatesbacteria bacterium]
MMADKRTPTGGRHPALTIDGRIVEFEEGMTVLEAARSASIYIPTLCFHPGLAPVGACRLCVVEVEGMRGFPASCSTPAREGMVVRTSSEEVTKLRRAILELILSEHPTGCLFCCRKQECEDFRGPGHLTKAGRVTGCMLCPNKDQCELRELVEKIGLAEVRFQPLYRDLPLERLDPFFDRDYNLCVLCGRCVRVCREVRGVSTLSFVHRGPHTKVGTAFGKLHLEMGCQFCGACVDVCPTGALADRTSKWEPRAEVKVETTCTLCTVGCSIEVSASGGRVVSAKPSPSGGVNQGQMCVLGRFGIAELVNSGDRITRPLIRRVGQLTRASWDEALALAADGLSRFDPSETALLYPGLLTDEEANACRGFARLVLKTENYPHRTRPEKWGSFDASLATLSEGDCVLLIGADLVQTHPVLGHNVKRAVDRGAKLLIVDTVPTFLDNFASAKVQAIPGDFSWAVAGLIWGLVEMTEGKERSELERPKVLPAWAVKLLFEEIVSHTKSDVATLEQAFSLLRAASKTLVLVGREVGAENTHTHFNGLLSDLRILLSSNTQQCEVCFAGTTKDFDAHWLKVMQNIEAQRVKALVMVGDLVPKLSPEWPNPLQDLDFLVVIDSHNGSFTPFADVVLPSTVFAEKEGTFTAVDGTLHELRCAVTIKGQSKPECEILNLLAKAMGADDSVPSIMGSDSGLSTLDSGLSMPKRDSSLSEQPSAPDWSREEVKCSNEWPTLLVNRHNSYLFHGHRLSSLVGGIRSLCMSELVRLSKRTADGLGVKDGEEVDLVSEKGRARLLVGVDDQIPFGILVSRLTAKDPRLLALMGKEQASFLTNSAAVRVETR